MRFLIITAFFIFTTLIHAEPPKEQWMTVLLDGRKIGSFETTRELRDSRVITTQRMDVSIERAGIRLAVASEEVCEETIDGHPLAFRSISKFSGIETITEGKVDNGHIKLSTRTGGQHAERVIDWPQGALLVEGLRLLGLHAGLKPGTHYEALAFQPSSLDAVKMTGVVKNAEIIALPAGQKTLYKIEETLNFQGMPMHNEAWVDAEQTVYKSTMPILGVELTLLACDKACAQAPNQSADIFQHTLLQVSRPLTPAELAQGLRYTLAARTGSELSIPKTDEQRVHRSGKEVIVEVLPLPMKGQQPSPAPHDTAPNDWLQSQAPEIIQLANQAAGDAKDSLERMRRLEQFVRSYILKKNLSVGYASALEVARKPEGDCTEHALLLAALGRALGIATHVVNGLVYTASFADSEQVFVPHAWVQAWVDGRWQSFDAALFGFDAGHIALAVGNGDPWRFYSGIDTLGRITMRRVEPLISVHPVTH